MARNYSSIASEKALAGNVSNIATQITLDNVTNLPSPPYTLVLNPDTAIEEIITVDADQSGVSAPTLKVTRAQDGTTAQTHTAGQIVRHMITGRDLQDAQNHIDATAAHGATGAVVGTTNTQTLTNKTLTTPKINENVTLTATSTELNVLDGITASTAELNYTDGVTSAIQTQIDTKAPSAGPTFTGNVVLPSTTSIGNVSATELGYVDGVTSAIQTQLNTIVNTTIPNAIPTGSVHMWVTGTAPTGWLLCQGQAVSRTLYATLFDVISTTYGVGDNSTTFNLPDLRGRVPMGAGTGRNVADSANLTARTLGTKVSDAETHTLTTAEIPSHNHTSLILGSNSSNTGLTVGSIADTQTSTGFTGGGQPHNNTQPSTVINFIIKF